MFRSRLFLGLTGCGFLLCVALLTYGQLRDGNLNGKRQLVKGLGLTDLALFSEARYTRHPSQADLFSAFQDYPAALEHFPSGSLIAPAPVGLNRWISIHDPNERRP
ncbi:MAG: hypothetical protein RQ754_12835 [Desulfuromonadales bacterium]|jgi:hypothetical protein|nr:hypothetical protein [Desulfuromonadales bacterium]